MDRVLLALVVAVITGASPLTAQLPDDTTSVEVAYRDHRLEIETGDGGYLLTLQWRLQLRASAPFDAPPDEHDELAAMDETTMRVRRARLKVGGHAYRPWLGYYLEYDFPSTTLLDWRMTLGPDAAQVRVGQWKVNYSRERVASSGTQQFVERSIVNEVFTLDRQVGLMLMGHAFSGSHADVRYYAGAMTGTGAGASANDDEHLLWLGRLEWQPLGADPGMEAGDLDRRMQPALTVAGAAATNRSPYTSFSGSGGEQLYGFEEGGPGRYRVRQAMFETAFKYRGVSWQHETHWKQVHDAALAQETDY